MLPDSLPRRHLALQFRAGVRTPAVGKLDNIQGRATRTAIVTTTGGDSATVEVTGNNSVCCDTKQVQLQLQQGSNGITFANPGGEAPAIDRITVSKP